MGKLIEIMPRRAGKTTQLLRMAEEAYFFGSKVLFITPNEYIASRYRSKFRHTNITFISRSRIPEPDFLIGIIPDDIFIDEYDLFFEQEKWAIFDLYNQLYNSNWTLKYTSEYLIPEKSLNIYRTLRLTMSPEQIMSYAKFTDQSRLFKHLIGEPSFKIKSPQKNISPLALEVPNSFLTETKGFFLK